MTDEHRARASSFGAEADRYDRVRPGYPAALIDHLVAAGPSSVLDVGCGTGISARLLAARGCRVLGLEPDPRMAAVARGNGLDVEEASFETWDRSRRRFDLITFGQSWHWVDADAGVRLAAEALVPGGRLGLFWNSAVLPPDVRAALGQVYRRVVPGLEGRTVVLGDVVGGRVGASSEKLRASPSFTDVTVSRFDHNVAYTTGSWVDLLKTHSDHAVLEPSVRAELLAGVAGALDGLGGRFTLRYVAHLVSAGRAAGVNVAPGGYIHDMAIVRSPGYAHVRLTVTDIARSKDFYDSVFGWPTAVDSSDRVDEPGVRESAEQFYGGVVYQTPSGALFGLRPVGADGFDSERTGLDHVSFLVEHRDDLVSARGALAEAGIEHGEVTDLDAAGLSILSFSDPDGVHLELTAPL